MTEWFAVHGVEQDKPGYNPIFDEIVTGPVDSIHIERMTEQGYWMSITRGDETIAIWFAAANNRSHVNGRFERWKDSR